MHLFIALTSASFNASDFIERVEMKRAFERHDTGHCEEDGGGGGQGEGSEGR